jgi:hypothetical protein
MAAATFSSRHGFLATELQGPIVVVGVVEFI